MRGLGLAGLVGLALACGGVGGGGSAKAEKLCELLRKTNEGPCESLPFGGFVEQDGIRVEVTGLKAGVVPPAPKNSGPDSGKLRATGGHVLVVEMTIHNDQVTRLKEPFALTVRTPDGEERTELWGSVKQYAAKNGLGDGGEPIPPGASVDVAAVVPAPEGQTDGVLLEFISWDKRPDPRDPLGRTKYFAVGQYTMEAPAATPL